MVFRLIAALAVSVSVSGGSDALAAQDIQPRPGALLRGDIEFPREQAMTIQTDSRDGSRLTFYMGFDGRCRGGGLAEVWAMNIPTRSTLRVKKGRFSGSLRGVARNLGGVDGRDGSFRWKISGRFLERDVATATVTGRGEIRVGRKVVSRCTIARPAPVRLTRDA